MFCQFFGHPRVIKKEEEICFSIHYTLLNVIFIGPCIIVITEESKNQLDAT